MLIALQVEIKLEGVVNYRLICKCGYFEIDCRVLRCIDNINYVAFDVKLWDKIEEKFLIKKVNIKLDLVMQVEWNYQGCQKKLGIIFLYNGVRLFYLSQKFFSYDIKDGDRLLLVQQWKKLLF